MTHKGRLVLYVGRPRITTSPTYLYTSFMDVFVADVLIRAAHVFVRINTYMKSYYSYEKKMK